jgi:hypothetical protein
MCKLMMSQASDGSWSATTSTAFALEARDRSETAALKPTLFDRIKEALSSVMEELEDNRGDAAEAFMQALRDDEPDDDAKAAVDDEAEPEFAKDDPLSCSPLAIVRSIPAALAAVQAADPSIDVTRVWCTMCCISSLQRLNVCWVVGDGDIYDDPERTIVDAGREWVERYAVERPQLAAALADGSMRLAAKRTTRLWRRACAERVAQLRRSEALTSQMGVSHLHRASTELARAIITKVRLRHVADAQMRRAPGTGAGGGAGAGAGAAQHAGAVSQISKC